MPRSYTKTIEPLETLTGPGGKVAEIYPDEGCDKDPRQWDNLGVMVCFHGRYDLGDKGHGYSKEGFSGWDELEAAIREREDPVEIWPLYLLDHSGLWIRTGPFHEDPGGWDSGRVGFIFAPRDAVLKEFSTKRITKEIRFKVSRILRGEVETYCHYLAGEVYGYDIRDAEGELLDSCGGFLGSEDVRSAALAAMA